MILRIAIILFALWATNSAADTRMEMTRYFDLHSDPWLNLHHFLYQWARAEEGIGEGRQKVVVPERDSIGILAGDDRDTWNTALAFYRQEIAGLSHFDDAMLTQKFMLLRLGGNLDGRPESEIAGIGEVLELAMPIYADTWWPDHDDGNRQWLADIAVQLRASEQEFVDLMERLFNAEWPDESRRVDVSAYANFRAGYTALGHTVMYSSDPGVAGIYGLEMLYHEVQHVREISRPSRTQLAQAFDQSGVPVPRNLSHGIIFGTAGAFTTSIAHLFGIESHQTYWAREGFATLGTWADVFKGVEQYWSPAVSGTVTPAEALNNIAGYFESIE